MTLTIFSKWYKLNTWMKPVLLFRHLTLEIIHLHLLFLDIIMTCWYQGNLKKEVTSQWVSSIEYCCMLLSFVTRFVKTETLSIALNTSNVWSLTMIFVLNLLNATKILWILDFFRLGVGIPFHEHWVNGLLSVLRELITKER